MSALLDAPFPWFGGKSRAASLIWEAIGNCANYVEPFAGSLAVLLRRPHAPHIETVNDKDAFLANVWRALQADPDGVAAWCDWPPNEADQHARHCWLVAHREDFTARLMGDPTYYDAQVAGWWLYGICCWIGGGWCSGEGRWQSVEGQLVQVENTGNGVKRRRVHLGNAGRGVHRQLVHLGDAGQGVHRQRVHLGGGHGQVGQGINTMRASGDGLYAWFAALQARLRYVRVCCGDWTRVLGPSPTTKLGLTGVLLDPPYPTEAERDMGLYREEDGQVAHDVEQWCAAYGDTPQLRIVMCGYGTIHDALLTHGWTRVAWKAAGGYGLQGNGTGRANASREVLWCSPACEPVAQQLSLWEEAP